MQDTLFDKIIRDEIPNWKVWEDDEHLAFLTPFPNTEGVTVVIPKSNPGAYVFDVDDDVYEKLMKAAKRVAAVLQEALHVDRVALVFEGTGVPFLHAKLYPLHGELGSKTGVWSQHQEFYPDYVGYLTTVEGPKMDDARLDELQKRIRQVWGE